MKRLTTIVLALALVATACGDDDATGAGLDSDDQAIADELTAEILGGSGTDVPLNAEEAGCFAAGLVDELGGDVMADAIQMEFEEFMAGASTDQRLIVVDTMMECIDFGEMMVAQFGGAIDDDAARCLGDAFAANDAFRAALASSFEGSDTDPFENDEVIAALLPAMLECLSPEQLVDLGGLEG
jgi:hypothetical protein